MRMIMLSLLASALAFSVQAQDSNLANMLSDSGADWILGTWTGTDPDGQAVTVVYGQELGGQAGSVHVKSGQMEIKALIAVDPYSGEVREFGASSQGALLTGTWDDQGSGPTFEATWTLPDGSRKQLTYIHRWVDAQTMRVVVYDGPSWKSDTTKYEIVFKRAS